MTMLVNWLKAGKIYTDRRMLLMLLLGFSSGFPLNLVAGTMNLWLKDSGASLALIGYLSLVKVPYSFKWLWSPIVDRVNLPLFHVLGRRRGWAVFTQLLLFLSLFGMSLIDLSKTTELLVFLAVFAVFSSASQDIVLDAYRIESFEERQQGAGTATFVMGYRIGMVFSGAGAIYLASIMSWNNVYFIMSFGALIGMATIFAAKEPKDYEPPPAISKGSFNQRAMIFLRRAVIRPFEDFMKRINWKIALLFILFYKMSDAYMGPMAYPFYDDMGFSKEEIALITKIYGVIATVGGSIVGGLLVSRFGILKSLLVCGIFQGVSNLMFVFQTYAGHSVPMLVLTISIENIAGGMATTSFVAYLSSLCNVAYTATQYALLSSLMSLPRDILASTSGTLAQAVGWEVFFILTTLMCLPGLFLLCFLGKESVNKVPQKVGKNRDKPSRKAHRPRKGD